MFYLATVKNILSHCHSLLARQYINITVYFSLLSFLMDLMQSWFIVNQKGDKTKIRIQQSIRKNTGVKEINR